MIPSLKRRCRDLIKVISPQDDVQLHRKFKFLEGYLGIFIRHLHHQHRFYTGFLGLITTGEILCSIYKGDYELTSADQPMFILCLILKTISSLTPLFVMF
uniref:Uncharacterized protein n=1 Tax=Helianthus annuus TaxID=4232 RepID=A0A251SKH6_HELAN